MRACKSLLSQATVEKSRITIVENHIVNLSGLKCIVMWCTL